ncbi:hypothetical protein LC1981_0469 [Lacticaseibacillus paracasei NRIC 1981]|uniref:replication initiation factor domain-containing protein n=1 Tax=Lacticaseibacillus paracasei TaxID=1597 RepID=UPI0005DEF228|nr:replication initiation factor domain-containing protein [Lacticaseibacillus paracasei]GAN41250.1 hypothetical protein LC1981_0469 [Lacticaseibacillus paracasei NRIC 1981]
MIQVSLDNLTLKSEGTSFQKSIPSLLGEGWELVNDFSVVYKVSRIIGGLDKQVRGVYMAPYRFTDQNLGTRVEFNPNYISVDRVSALLSHIFGAKHWELTRVDIAWDLIDEYDLTNYLIDRTRVKRNILQSSVGRLQTIYLGSPRSEKQVRIYDKFQERSDAKDTPVGINTWWRVEAQMRSSVAKNWRSEASSILPCFINVEDLSDYDRLISLAFMNGEDLSFLSEKKLRGWRSRCKLSESDLRLRLCDCFNSNLAELRQSVDLVTSKLEPSL